MWFYTSVLIGRIETNTYEDVCGLRNVQGSRPTWSVDILHPCRCRYFGNVLNLSWGWYKLSYYRSSTWRLMGTSRRGGRRNMWWRCDPLSSSYLSASWILILLVVVISTAQIMSQAKNEMGGWGVQGHLEIHSFWRGNASLSITIGAGSKDGAIQGNSKKAVDKVYNFELLAFFFITHHQKGRNFLIRYHG